MNQPIAKEITCEWCGYRSPSSLCPECGRLTAAQARDLRTIWKSRARQRFALLGCCLLFTLFLAVFPALARSLMADRRNDAAIRLMWLACFLLSQLMVAGTLFESVRAAVVCIRHDYNVDRRTRKNTARIWLASFCFILMIAWGSAFLASI